MRERRTRTRTRHVHRQEDPWYDPWYDPVDLWWSRYLLRSFQGRQCFVQIPLRFSRDGLRVASFLLCDGLFSLDHFTDLQINAHVISKFSNFFGSFLLTSFCMPCFPAFHSPPLLSTPFFHSLFFFPSPPTGPLFLPCPPLPGRPAVSP